MGPLGSAAARPAAGRPRVESPPLPVGGDAFRLPARHPRSDVHTAAYCRWKREAAWDCPPRASGGVCGPGTGRTHAHRRQEAPPCQTGAQSTGPCPLVPQTTSQPREPHRVKAGSRQKPVWWPHGHQSRPDHDDDDDSNCKVVKEDASIALGTRPSALAPCQAAVSTFARDLRIVTEIPRLPACTSSLDRCQSRGRSPWSPTRLCTTGHGPRGDRSQL